MTHTDVTFRNLTLELQTTKKMQLLKYFLTCKQQWKSDLVMLKVCQRGEIAKSRKQGEQSGNRLNVTKLSRTVRITKLFGLRGDFRSFAEMNNFAWLHSCNMQNVLRPFLKLSVSVFQSYLNLTAISLEVQVMNFLQVVLCWKVYSWIDLKLLDHELLVKIEIAFQYVTESLRFTGKLPKNKLTNFLTLSNFLENE